jgi:beta-phosphoglucomutase-like phosphatase (HAD superfamily)
MIKAILFDRDGVIINSESSNVLSVVRTFEKLGMSISEDDKCQIVGRDPVDYLVHFQEKYGFSIEEFRKIQGAIYYELFALAPLCDDMIRFVNDIKKEKYLVALTTTGRMKGTQMLFERA